MTDSCPRPPSDPRPGEGDVPGRATLLTGARLTDSRTVDVRLEDGLIAAVAPAGTLKGTEGPLGSRVDLEGCLLLPAPVEPHAHSDTVLLADEPDADPADPVGVQRRATEAALLQLGHGATSLRCHVHIGSRPGLRSLEAVLAARRSLHGLADLTVVAVPERLTGASGAEGRALLRDAIRMGAGAIGGRPDRDPDPDGFVRLAGEPAAEHALPLDLHTDATDLPLFERLTAFTAEHPTPLTLSPCGGLSRLPYATAARLADALAAAGTGVVCLPQGGCADARNRAVAPVGLLRAAGVRLAAGSGSLRDRGNPAGRGDPLEAAYLLASRHSFSPDEAYAAISSGARGLLGLPEVRIEPGSPAELLAVRGDRLAGALSLAYSRVVIHRGRVVARTSAVREYCDSAVAVGLDLPRQIGPAKTPGPGGT